MPVGPPPRPIRACLFDMDGLLLDSEDLYTICSNKILRSYGKPDMPWHIKAQMQGRPGPEASAIFEEWSQIPRDTYVKEMQVLQNELFPSARPLPGVVELLTTLAATSDPPTHIALATSSHARNFALKTSENLKLFEVFTPERRVLGDDPRIPPGRGKPAPDIYLLALETINQGLRREGVEKEILPEECLVFEDSVPGVEAGRRAGMQAIWCPHPGLLSEYKGKEKEVLAGLTGQHVEAIPPAIDTSAGGKRVQGAPGEIDDGWAVFLQTLENFPYEKFGIKVGA